MAATALPAMLDALLGLLDERSGLSGVKVYTCPVDPADLGTESVMFAAEVTIAQEQAAMSSTDLTESFDVPGVIVCFAPVAPGRSPNVAAKVCRDRACDILEEVTEVLAADRTVDGSVLDAQMSEVLVKQGMAPEGQLGRWCSIEFTISAEAHTTP